MSSFPSNLFSGRGLPMAQHNAAFKKNTVNADLYARALAEKSKLGLLQESPDSMPNSAALTALRSYGPESFGTPPHSSMITGDKSAKVISNEDKNSAKPSIPLLVDDIDDEDKFLYGEDDIIAKSKSFLPLKEEIRRSEWSEDDDEPQAILTTHSKKKPSSKSSFSIPVKDLNLAQKETIPVAVKSRDLPKKTETKKQETQERTVGFFDNHMKILLSANKSKIRQKKVSPKPENRSSLLANKSDKVQHSQSQHKVAHLSPVKIQENPSSPKEKDTKLQNPKLQPFRISTSKKVSSNENVLKTAAVRKRTNSKEKFDEISSDEKTSDFTSKKSSRNNRKDQNNEDFCINKVPVDKRGKQKYPSASSSKLPLKDCINKKDKQLFENAELVAKSLKTKEMTLKTNKKQRSMKEYDRKESRSPPTGSYYPRETESSRRKRGKHDTVNRRHDYEETNSPSDRRYSKRGKFEESPIRGHRFQKTRSYSRLSSSSRSPTRSSFERSPSSDYSEKCLSRKRYPDSDGNSEKDQRRKNYRHSSSHSSTSSQSENSDQYCFKTKIRTLDTHTKERQEIPDTELKDDDVRYHMDLKSADMLTENDVRAAAVPVGSRSLVQDVSGARCTLKETRVREKPVEEPADEVQEFFQRLERNKKANQNQNMYPVSSVSTTVANTESIPMASFSEQSAAIPTISAYTSTPISIYGGSLASTSLTSTTAQSNIPGYVHPFPMCDANDAYGMPPYLAMGFPYNNMPSPMNQQMPYHIGLPYSSYDPYGFYHAQTYLTPQEADISDMGSAKPSNKRSACLSNLKHVPVLEEHHKNTVVVPLEREDKIEPPPRKTNSAETQIQSNSEDFCRDGNKRGKSHYNSSQDLAVVENKRARFDSSAHEKKHNKETSQQKKSIDSHKQLKVDDISKQEKSTDASRHVEVVNIIQHKKPEVSSSNTPPVHSDDFYETEREYARLKKMQKSFIKAAKSIKQEINDIEALESEHLKRTGKINSGLRADLDQKKSEHKELKKKTEKIAAGIKLLIGKPEITTMPIENTLDAGELIIDEQAASRETEEIPKIKFFDAGSHWCQQCNEIFPTVLKKFEHLHSNKHKQLMDPLKRPWLKAIKPDENFSSSTTKTLPIAGCELIMPVQGLYCIVCDETFPDDLPAERHLRLASHYKNYQKYIDGNLDYDRRYHSAMNAGLNIIENEKRKIKNEQKKKEVQGKHGTKFPTSPNGSGNVRMNEKSKKEDNAQTIQKKGITLQLPAPPKSAVQGSATTLKKIETRVPGSKIEQRIVYIGKSPALRAKKNKIGIVSKEGRQNLAAGSPTQRKEFSKNVVPISDIGLPKITAPVTKINLPKNIVPITEIKLPVNTVHITEIELPKRIVPVTEIELPKSTPNITKTDISKNLSMLHSSEKSVPLIDVTVSSSIREGNSTLTVGPDVGRSAQNSAMVKKCDSQQLIRKHRIGFVPPRSDALCDQATKNENAAGLKGKVETDLTSLCSNKSDLSSVASVMKTNFAEVPQSNDDQPPGTSNEMMTDSKEKEIDYASLCFKEGCLSSEASAMITEFEEVSKSNEDQPIRSLMGIMVESKEKKEMNYSSLGDLSVIKTDFVEIQEKEGDLPLKTLTNKTGESTEEELDFAMLGIHKDDVTASVVMSKPPSSVLQRAFSEASPETVTTGLSLPIGALEHKGEFAEVKIFEAHIPECDTKKENSMGNEKETVVIASLPYRSIRSFGDDVPVTCDTQPVNDFNTKTENLMALELSEEVFVDLPKLDSPEVILPD